MIHSIRIKNYKSIRDVSVELNPVTVFVGRSGTGKSNFLEAISKLKELIVGGHDTKSWPTHLGQADQQFLFDCEFSVDGYDSTYRYELEFRKGTNRLGGISGRYRECLKLGERILFHHGPNSEGAACWIVEPDVMNPPKPSGILIGKLPAMAEAVVAYTTLTSGLGFYDFSDTVLTGKSKGGQGGLDSNGANYLAVLKGISQDLRDVGLKKGLVATMKRVNPTIESLELNDLQNPTTVIVAHRFQQEAKLEQLSLAQESAGVRRFYAHLLALYQKPPKQTLMFEHPEDGIHPGAMELLAEEFKDAAVEGRGQVLLTTHNPMLLDHFNAEQIRVVALVDSETQIGPIEETQQEAIRKDLLDAGELLTTDPARLRQES